MAMRVVNVYVEERIFRVELDGHQTRTVNALDLAMEFARGLARDVGGGEVRIHYADGRVESEYHGDPDRAAPGGDTSRENLRTRLDAERRQHQDAADRGDAERCM
jgi:hypothetical protein